MDAVCVAPWVSLELDPAGWVYICCANQFYPVGRIGDERLHEIWAGPRVRAMRDSLRRWDLSNGCGSCRWHLERGRTDTDAAVYDHYDLAGEEPGGPRSMTFALSNRCNLQCVMCNEELSSSIRRAKGLAPLPDRYGDEFFEDLERFLPGLEYAKFLGGEPFLVPSHLRVWEMMARVGSPTRIQVTTNATVWNDRVEWLLDTFDVDVTVSIDAVTPEAYERIRGGADHGEVMRNVERFRRYCAERSTEFRVCMCLMHDNWRELPLVLSWADELEAPLSVNVVFDEGLSLHESNEDGLQEVVDAWRAVTSPFRVNPGVLPTQLAAVDHELARRRSGQGPVRFRATPRRGLELAGLERLGADAPGPEEQRRALAGWSSDGEVAEVWAQHDGTVTEVRSEHRRFGLTDLLVGGRVDDVMAQVERADGRTLWGYGEEIVESWRVVVSILSEGPPARGHAASIVRTTVADVGEHLVLLLAEDRIRDRDAGVPVEIGPRRDTDG